MNEDNPLSDSVILLGAGASKSEEAPLQSELFQNYFRYIRSLDRDLVSYLTVFFGLDLEPEDNRQYENLTFPTCEEALGVLEMAISKREGFSGNENFQRNRLENIRDKLIRAISLSIARSLESSMNRRKRYHDILASQLKVNTNTAIISTNYDILIDDALDKEKHPIDYGFDFRFQRKDGEITTYSRPQNGILLYKIHGSLNWLYCPTCKGVDLTPLVKSVDGMSCNNLEHQTDCREVMTPVLIPPTYMKDISPHFLQSVWESSELLLRRAKRIIFCGYSFPDADIHLKYLLKRAEMNRLTSDPLEVFVVNHHRGKNPSAIIQEYERYFRFLRNHACFHYTRQSFQDFCEKGLDASDEFSKTEIDCMKL